jgi:hypothetical protein
MKAFPLKKVTEENACDKESSICVKAIIVCGYDAI